MSTNKQTSIVSANEHQPVNLSEFYNTYFISADRANALQVILTGDVPKEVIRTHPGAGGKVFKYIDHVWITKQLRKAFGAMWSFEASDAVLEPDGSASARGKLTVKYPMPDNPEFFESTFIEYGACNTKTGMTDANKKLSAASKALVRCAFRAFGIGQDFYDTSDDILTNKRAWDLLENQILVNYKGYVTVDDLRNYCHEHNIGTKDLAENFELLWEWISDIFVERRKNGKHNL